MNRQAIEKLEGLKLGLVQKLGVILVLADEKPAAEVLVFKWNDAPEDVIAVIEELGLVFEQRQEHRNENIVATLCVSKKPELAKALQQVQPYEDFQEYGKLMGYPATAIEAFVNKESFIPANELIMLAFPFSEENYEQERAVIDRWESAIEQYSPNLYAEMVAFNQAGIDEGEQA